MLVGETCSYLGNTAAKLGTVFNFCKNCRLAGRRFTKYEPFQESFNNSRQKILFFFFEYINKNKKSCGALSLCE